ncbi:MAG: hypothetical protein JJU13_10335 [Balneolaceae bacterium]|nr:hypothetical protein [Balneolaceae bacterium]
MTDLMKTFNTRLPDEVIEQIQATAWHKRTTIQNVVQTALEEFFKDREQETETAVEAFRNKDNGL